MNNCMNPTHETPEADPVENVTPEIIEGTDIIDDTVHSSYDMENILKMVDESEGEEVHSAKPYGIGIDTAAKFIDVTVFVIQGDKCMSYYRRFLTDWNSLVTAKAWAVGIIENCSDPKINLHDLKGDIVSDFHYCIESTGNLHKPILYGWNGSPSIINPSIAGATKRKTDKLDSKLMALQDMTGVWSASFIPSLEVEAVRVIQSEYVFADRMRTRISNRINSKLLQFGFNVSIAGSVTMNNDVRATVMNLISDNPTPNKCLCSNELPMSVRLVLREMYAEYDNYCKLADQHFNTLVNTVQEMYWETADTVIKGDKMLEILCTAPGVGLSTAILWLIQIVTPRRFHNSKAIAAYCGTDPSLKISADKVVSTKKRGGNLRLHAGLCQAASTLIRNESEMFGRWGSNIFARSGKWKKATNAVGRKLAVALYFMQMKGEEFSYEKYSICRSIKVLDITLEEYVELVPAFKRYVKILNGMNIHTTQEMVDAYNLCKFNSTKGVGQKFFDNIQNFIMNQKEFEKEYSDRHTREEEA